MVNNFKREYDVFLLVTQAYSDKVKKNPSAPNRSRTYDLPISTSDALPLSYRRLVVARPLNFKRASMFSPLLASSKDLTDVNGKDCSLRRYTLYSVGPLPGHNDT